MKGAASTDTDRGGGLVDIILTFIFILCPPSTVVGGSAELFVIFI